jgi:hypothetical protein
VKIQRLKKLYNLHIKPLHGPTLLVASGDLKTVCSEAAALLPNMANYDKVRRELLRSGGVAWAAIELHGITPVLVTIIWQETLTDIWENQNL